jgi:hypothetical protein
MAALTPSDGNRCLVEINRLAEGDAYRTIQLDEVAKNVGLTIDQVRALCTHLRQEDLIKFEVHAGGGNIWLRASGAKRAHDLGLPWWRRNRAVLIGVIAGVSSGLTVAIFSELFRKLLTWLGL